MRVMLVNPAMNMEALGKFQGLLEPMPVIGLAYIAGVLQQDGHRVKAIDQFTYGMGIDKVIEQMRDFKPDVVGIGMLTPSTPVAIKIAEKARAALPHVRLIAGNVHADIFYKEILGGSEFDFVVHGEGEYTISELVKAFDSGDTDYTAINGISFVNADGEVQKTPDRPVIQDLDALPYPAWNLFPYTRYGLLPFADIAHPVLSMTGSRGCPYRCEFCSLLYTGSNYRKRDPIKVVDEYEYLYERYGVKQIGFVDPIFPLNKKVLFAFCEELMRRGLHKKLCWLSETRVDRIDRESLRIMRASGCRRLLLGIESGVDLLLENVNKTFTTETTRRAVTMIREEKIDSVGLFMIGLPGETIELRQSQVFIDGEPIDEPYLDAMREGGRMPPDFRATFGPQEVPEGHLFMMGDNRGDSQDSRYWGALPVEYVKGRAFVLYWSYESESEFYVDVGIGPTLRRLGSSATHFFTRTRWNRLLKAVP